MNEEFTKWFFEIVKEYDSLVFEFEYNLSMRSYIINIKRSWSGLVVRKFALTEQQIKYSDEPDSLVKESILELLKNIVK